MAKSKASQKNRSERPSAIARQFIETLRQQAKEQGKEYIDLVSGEIHKELNWKSRLPLVCDAMRNSLKPGDEFIHTTPSGKSSTITIRYYTTERPEAKATVAQDLSEDIFMHEDQNDFSEQFSQMAKTKICRERSRLLHAAVAIIYCVLSAIIGFAVARMIFGSRNN